jgi:hypothetical protein
MRKYELSAANQNIETGKGGNVGSVCDSREIYCQLMATIALEFDIEASDGSGRSSLSANLNRCLLLVPGFGCVLHETVRWVRTSFSGFARPTAISNRTYAPPWAQQVMGEGHDSQ